MVTIDYQKKLDFKDVLLVPQPSEIESRQEVNLYKLDQKSRHVIPIILANMDFIGTFEMANYVKKFGILTALIKDYSYNDWVSNIVKYSLVPQYLIPTIGLTNFNSEVDKLKQIIETYPVISMISVDCANGYLKSAAESVYKLSQIEMFKGLKISIGNIVTPEVIPTLAAAGAHVIKVGIGAGGACLTREKAGIGYPQFSAIIDCIQEARQCGIEIISDGGIINPGDFGKAFAAGADYVMAGSIFAGHNENGSEFRGMSSDAARIARNEDVKQYRSSEGRSVNVKLKGSIDGTIRDILGGLRSTCTYLGVKNLIDLKNHPIKVVTVNRQLNDISDHRMV